MAGLNGHAHAEAAEPRSFLLLQGPIGPLFWLLARRLRRAGHRVTRVLFNGGDRLFWRGPGAVAFRGSLEQWPDFLQDLLRRHAVTDIVLVGDCRPLHRAAVAAVRDRGVAVHVLEEGYLRPHCLTLEREGVNGFSRLLRTPAWFMAQAHAVPPWRSLPAH